MSFRIELINPNIFKVAFESISEIVDEVVLNIEHDGFNVDAIDRSHICFASLKLEDKFFDEYQVDVPEKICLDTQELMTILKRMKKNDVLCLTSDEQNNFILQLKGDVDREFKIKIIDANYDIPPIPSIPLSAQVNIPSGLLTESIKDMELFSEYLRFKVDSDYFIVDAEGEFGDSEVKYIHGENIQKQVASSFSIDKLKQIVKSSKFSDDVTIHLDTDKPLRLDYNLLTDDGSLSFLLAPRLEVDD